MTMLHNITTDYRLHHVALARGYVSRKPGAMPKIIPYNGRFGMGYKVLRPCYHTTRFVWCEYWVK